LVSLGLGDVPMSACRIAVANCKGGCGKTTTAVNLAAEIAARGYRTLLVDLDPQGQASLGRSWPQGVASARGLPAGSRYGPQSVVRGGHGAPDLLPADRGFWQSPKAACAGVLAEALACVSEPYDAVIFDTPPAADLPMVAALSAAHHVLTPTQLTPLSCDGVFRFAQVFFYVATTINPELRSFAISPTQVDLRIRMQQASLARLNADFGAVHVLPGIRSDVALAEAFGVGRPIRDFRPNTRGAADYARLSDAIEAAWLGRTARSRPDVSVDQAVCRSASSIQDMGNERPRSLSS
jgi:chromosome partitioning protein